MRDPEGYEIKEGDLVLFNGKVYKVKSLLGDFMHLWNTNGTVTGVAPCEVQWLSEDTITVPEVNSKKDKSKFHVGDFGRRKEGSGRVFRITKVDRKWLTIEYFYDGAHCTGQIHEAEVEPAKKPDSWESWETRYKRNKERGRGFGRVFDINTGGVEGCGDGGGYYGFPSYRPSGLGSFSYREAPEDSEDDERTGGKKDSITKQDLIRKEVRRLTNEENRQPAKGSSKEEKPKLKTRKGDW